MGKNPQLEVLRLLKVKLREMEDGTFVAKGSKAIDRFFFVAHLPMPLLFGKETVENAHQL